VRLIIVASYEAGNTVMCMVT